MRPRRRAAPQGRSIRSSTLLRHRLRSWPRHKRRAPDARIRHPAPRDRGADSARSDAKNAGSQLARRSRAFNRAEVSQLPSELWNRPIVSATGRNASACAGRAVRCQSEARWASSSLARMHARSPFARVRSVGGQIEPARFHGDRVDQAVDPLHGLRALQSGLELRGQRGSPVRAADRNRGQHHRDGGEQNEDRVQLENNGDVGQPGHFQPLEEPGRIDINPLTPRLH